MKKRMVISLLAIFCSVTAFAMGEGTSISKIQGVELWFLSSDSNGNSSDYFGFSGIEPSLAEHCNGENTVYIFGRKSQFVCEADINEYGQAEVTIFDTGQIAEDYYVVSREEIPFRSWSLDLVTEDELGRVSELVFENIHSAPTWGDRDKTVTSLPPLESIGSENRRFIADSKIFYITPIRRLISEAGDEDIVSSIVLSDNGSYSFLGFVEGCVTDLNDLDRDEVPELRTITCTPGEGVSSRYWKIFPTSELILEYFF